MGPKLRRTWPLAWGKSGPPPPVRKSITFESYWMAPESRGPVPVGGPAFRIGTLTSRPSAIAAEGDPSLHLPAGWALVLVRLTRNTEDSEHGPAPAHRAPPKRADIARAVSSVGSISIVGRSELRAVHSTPRSSKVVYERGPVGRPQ